MIVNNQKHDDYFVHQIEVKDYRHLNRLDLFVPLVKSKSVLHVGNIDWPITDPQNSLHLRLAEVANNIDGIDLLKKRSFRDYLDIIELNFINDPDYIELSK